MARPIAEATELAERAVEEARKHIVVTRAYLFGSYVEGTPHEHSDIDLAIFTPTFEELTWREHLDVCRAIRKCTSHEVQVLLFSDKKLAEARPTNFAGHIIEVGKRVA